MTNLLFVYNATSGKGKGLLEGIHKMWNPSAYSCSLCNLTHGLLFEKKQWKDFRKLGGLEMNFYHADEFQKLYASKFGFKYTFPVVLLADENKGLEILISTEEINGMKEVEELIKTVEERLPAK